MARIEYRLYRWKFAPYGLLTPVRGGILARHDTFGSLKESAIRRARLAGYYEDDDWMFLFDWEKAVGDSTVARPLPGRKAKGGKRGRKTRKRAGVGRR